jgi:hypothetical protein
MLEKIAEEESLLVGRLGLGQDMASLPRKFASVTKISLPLRLKKKCFTSCIAKIPTTCPITTPPTKNVVHYQHHN